MFFTQEDYIKIQQWLSKNSVKDTEFNEANIPFNGEETITIVQGNQNKKVFLKDLIAQVFNLGISDFVNITDKYDAPNISLEEAIRLIPSRARKEGQVITFLDRKDHWHIYQFKGALNQWNVLDVWEDLFDWEKLIIDSILPDEEDLTKSPADENGNSYLSLKDRAYNPKDFSGLGRVILRKNIVEVEDFIYGKVKSNILYQDMFNQTNTIYEIRYDFDLRGTEIIIPEGCVLDFQGGKLSNGNIVGTNTLVKAGIYNIFDTNINIKGTWIASESYPEWFGAKGDGIADDREAFNKAILFTDIVSLSTNKTYNIVAYKDDIINTKRVGILLKDNSILRGNNATIKTSNNKGLGYNILCCYGVNNVLIENIWLYGDKGENENPKQEHGQGVGIHGSSNIYVNNVKATNMQGDGFYIASLDTTTGDEKKSSDITITNCYANDNYRNALSIICGDYITVKNSQFYNHGYYATIDLEPNHNYENIKNVRFENCYIRNKDINYAAFANDDTVDQSTSQVVLSNCEIVGWVRVLQSNPSSFIELQNCNITNGYVSIDSIGKTTINNSYIKKDSRTHAISFEQKIVKTDLQNSQGTRITNTIIDCYNTIPYGGYIAINFMSGTSDSICKYYNIELLNIDVINDNNVRPIKLYNYAELDEESVKFVKLIFNGKYTESDLGNPIIISECDIKIKDTRTESYGSYLSFFEKYIFNTPTSISIRKGYIGEGLYYIYNNSEGNISISNHDFDLLLYNGNSTTKIIIPSKESAIVIIDYKNNICNIIKKENRIEFQDSLNASYNFTGHMYFAKDVNCLCINGIDGMKYIYADNVNKIGNARPSNIPDGYQFYDKTLNKPIWWTGAKWVDATGADV